VDLERQNRLKDGRDKPKLKVKMQSVSDNDDVQKTLLEKPRFELARTKGLKDTESLKLIGRLQMSS